MRITIRFLAVVAAFSLAFFMIGCGDSAKGTPENNEPINCIFIYSQHENSQSLDPEESASEIKGFISETKRAEGYIGFIRLDGNPVAVYNEQIKNEAKNQRKLEEEIEKTVDTRYEGLLSIKASENEVDILKSLTTANTYLGQATDKGRDNVVIIIGTGLSTTGDLNFASTGLESLDLKKLESWFENKGLLPKLDHIDRIVWYGFGNVDGQQEEFPTQKYQEQLEDFYTSLLKSAGVDEVEFRDIIGVANGQTSDLPYVSVVDMPPKPKYNANSEDVTLPANVLFNPDEATFLDDSDPKNNQDIIDIAYSIKAYDLKVTVTGYTAHYDTPKGNEALSLERAEAIKRVLVELGCPESNIKAVGGGKGPYGEGSEEIDQKNRCVVFSFDE